MHVCDIVHGENVGSAWYAPRPLGEDYDFGIGPTCDRIDSITVGPSVRIECSVHRRDDRHFVLIVAWPGVW